MKQEFFNQLFVCELTEEDSSYIKYFSYHFGKQELEIQIKNTGTIIYIDFPFSLFTDFIEADSFGRFYNEFIKSKFKTKKQQIMADLELGASIDLSKVNKDMLIYGKKKEDGTQPIYLNLRIKYNDKEDRFGQNGMVIQGVPKAYRTVHKGAQGEILGNCKDFTTAMRADLPKVGEEQGNLKEDDDDDAGNDLPF